MYKRQTLPLLGLLNISQSISLPLPASPMQPVPIPPNGKDISLVFSCLYTNPLIIHPPVSYTHLYTAVIGGLQSLGAFQYTSNKLGGELQYGLRLSGLNLLLNGGYTFRVEDAIRDISKPRKEGTFRDESLYANLAAVIEGADMHRVTLSYRKDNQSGIEYVQVLDQTYEVQQWVDLYSSVRSTYVRDDYAFSYDFYRGAAHEYRWKAGVMANYRSNDDRYIMPASSLKIQNLYLGVNGKVNIAPDCLARVVLGADFLYKKNLNGEYLYGGADPESIVITEFMIPDVAYLKQDYYKIGGSATLFTGIAGRTGLLSLIHI